MTPFQRTAEKRRRPSRPSIGHCREGRGSEARRSEAPDTPAALLRHILDELFGDNSQQHSVYGDPRGLLTSRKTQKDATDPGTTIGFSYDAKGNLLTRQQYLTGQGETFTHDEMGRLTKWESTGGHMYSPSAGCIVKPRPAPS